MELIDVLNNNKIDKQFLIDFCKKNRIKFKFENNDFSKLLFYTNNNIPNRSNLTYFCNGLILELIENKWQIVCFPLPNLADMKHFDKNEKYNVYPVYESSIINVYFSKLQNKWCFGTKKSFDIFPQTWRKVKYSDVLSVVNTDILDKNITHVFSVADKRLHMFSGTNHCFLIGKCSTECMEFLDELNTTVESSIKNVKNAFTRYLNNESVPILGYIFRNANSSILCESDLLKKINKMVYKPQYLKNKTDRKAILEKHADLDYVIAKCYVQDYSYSKILFPVFEPKFQILKKAESDLIEFLINKFSTRSISANNNDPQTQMEILFENFAKKHEYELNMLLMKNFKLRNLVKDYVFKQKDIDFLHELLVKFN